MEEVQLAEREHEDPFRETTRPFFSVPADEQASSDIGEMTDSILHDRFFRSLIALNVGINYYIRTGERHYNEGTERDKNTDTPLFTATLYVDCPNLEQRAVHDHVNMQGPLSMEDLERRLVREEGDGAYVVYTDGDAVHMSENKHIMMVNPRPIVEELREKHPHMGIQNMSMPSRYIYLLISCTSMTLSWQQAT